jgi:hypothetical protein
MNNLGEFLAELSLRLEKEGFEISYSEMSDGEPLALGSDGEGYQFSVSTYEDSIEVMLSGPADLPSENYTDIMTFEEVQENLGNPENMGIRTNGDRYFASMEIYDLDNPENLLDEIVESYRGLSELE